MIASLYHRGSFVSMISSLCADRNQSRLRLSVRATGQGMLSRKRRPPDALRLQIILEVSLGPYAPPDAEHMSRDDLRIQFHIVARPLPQVARLAEQFVQLVRLVP